MTDRNSAWPRLLAPGRIGAMHLRNRVVMPAMDQNLCTPDGLLTEANLDHYEQRAAGGVGLLILETSAVAYPHGATSRHQPSLGSDDCIPGLTALADRVHAHGAAMVVQACHHGRVAGVDVMEERPQLVPTLPMPPFDAGRFIDGLLLDEMMAMGERLAGNTPSFVEATGDDLAWVVDQFVAAARRVAASGCDGIEIHGAHGYLISTFLSPYWNHRSDEWGGSLVHRTRLLRDVVAGVVAATPDDFAVIVRLDGTEFGIDGGITAALAAEHARVAVDAGADAIHVSAYGAPDSGVAFTDGPLPWQPGQYRQLAKTVKAAVDVPVIAVGRLEPDTGESVLAAGEADFVAMGRQLLADPHLVARLNDNRADLIRPCINCFVCVAENFWDSQPVCAVNARLGRGVDAPEPATLPRHLVVIGGGPGGMEAARVAAIRGHRVTLIERNQYLGGTAHFSAVTTPKNGDLVAYLRASLDEAGVTVMLSTLATPEVISDLAPDVVIVATGAVRARPDIPGAAADHILSGDDLRDLLTGSDSGADQKLGVLGRVAVRAGRAIGATSDPAKIRELSRAWMPIGKHVVIIGGGLVGVELAEFLAERKRLVTVLESSGNLGSEMAHPRRWRALHEARTHGVTFHVDARPTVIDDSTVRWTVGDATQEPLRADHVIIADGVTADDSLATAIRNALPAIEVYTIGDAGSVGYIQGAIQSGFDAAVAI